MDGHFLLLPLFNKSLETEYNAKAENLCQLLPCSVNISEGTKWLFDVLQLAMKSSTSS